MIYAYNNTFLNLGQFPMQLGFLYDVETQPDEIKSTFSLFAQRESCFELSITSMISRKKIV